ncbi:MAG: FecR domain-containing protein, partial [Flavobacteriaceae bacterium]|nr:FecR domain-containing protein [Flavobacteriaceae bacterium]
NMSFDADQAFDSFQASVEKPKNKISKSIRRYAAIFIGIVGIAVLAGYFLLADHNKTPLSPEAAIILQAGDKTHRISVQNSTRFSNAQGQVWLTQKNDSLVFTENTHLLKPYHYISVPFGQTITLILPDKSVVQLNAGSSLIFENNFNTTSREVTLSGEGYFQIAHDKNKPFKVQTNKTEIVVLGTRFNIQSYKEDKQIVTTLISGSISFSSSSGKELVLQPKEQLIYNKQDQTLEQL